MELRSILRPPAGSFVRFKPHDEAFLGVAAKQVRGTVSPFRSPSYLSALETQAVTYRYTASGIPPTVSPHGVPVSTAIAPQHEASRFGAMIFEG